MSAYETHAELVTLWNVAKRKQDETSWEAVSACLERLKAEARALPKPDPIHGQVFSIQRKLLKHQACLDAVAQARLERMDAESDFHAAITRASASGLTYREIAKAADLSFQRVAQIVKDNRYPSEVK